MILCCPGFDWGGDQDTLNTSFLTRRLMTMGFIIMTMGEKIFIPFKGESISLSLFVYCGICGEEWQCSSSIA